MKVTWARAGLLVACLGAVSSSISCSKANTVTQEKDACAQNEYRCRDDKLQVCNDQSTGWDTIKACVAGTCDEAAETCEDANTCIKDADCASNLCLPDKTCAAPNVKFSGVVQRFDRLTSTGVSGATVSVVNVSEPAPLTTTESTGSYLLDGLPAQALIDMEIEFDDSADAKVFVPPQLARTVLSTDSFVDGAESKTINPQLVRFSWLAQTAVDCGLFDTIEEATGETPDGFINTYFTQRATLVGEIRDPSGKPVAGVKRADIDVILDGFHNTHLTAEDDDAQKPFVCFLDKKNTDEVVGTALDESTAIGRFVVFRVRNANGTGAGHAEVKVGTFAAQQVSIGSSGNIAYVSIGDGKDPPILPERDRDFETDIVPLFRKYACVGCHSEGEKGYEKAPLRGDDMLRADFALPPDELYAVLMASDGDCTDPDTPQRVCVEKPDASLLLVRPLVEPPDQDIHPTTVFKTTNQPDYQIIKQWITQGAKRGL